MLSALLLVAQMQGSTTPKSIIIRQHAPAYLQTPKINPTGRTILTNGRFLTPEGKAYPLPHWPNGMAQSPDGKDMFISTAEGGRVFHDWTTSNSSVSGVTVEKRGVKDNGGACVYSLDGSKVFWSSGDGGKIHVISTTSQEETASIALDEPENWKDSFASDLCVSADGKTLFAADMMNFRVAVIDIQSNKVISSVKVGRMPFAIASVGNNCYVANIGMFEYKAIPRPIPGSKHDARGLTRPPFKFPSKEARDGVDFEDRSIPGLGDPNVPESFSVWAIDASDPTKPHVTAKIKIGLLVGTVTQNGKTVGGSGPNFLLASKDSLWVSDGNSDIIERIDLTTMKIAARTRITLNPATAQLRGIGPSGMALSSDGKQLYVAESGVNAVAVLDPKSLSIKGHIPSAWYPYRVAVSHDSGQLATISFRGFGTGPRGVKIEQPTGFEGMRGVFILTDLVALNLKNTTQHVLENNLPPRLVSSNLVADENTRAEKPDIKYVVFITKENHTYDAIFDHVPGANGEPKLLKWGLHATVSAANLPTLTDVPVMPNHNALAREFTISDNFYMEPEASGVGHRWLVGVQPNNLMQMAYTLGWNHRVNSTAPGRLYPMGSNGSLLPEDYPEAGSMWEHVARFGKTFRNYGEGFEFPGVGEDKGSSPTGAHEVANYPMSSVLFDNTCFDFPIFNMHIPDQFRFAQFKKDLTEKFISKGTNAPAFLNIAICNDHGAGESPSEGYPYRASWMSDNDLALGKIVEFLSHTKYWKNMLILVTQDDSGGEGDHVDGQRSVLLAISPYVKRAYVSHVLTTITSMHRTLYEILGIPSLNLFDALANDFSDCFTSKPDLTPYTVRQVDARIFDPVKVVRKDDPLYKKAMRKASIRRDDPDGDEQL